MAFSTNVNIIIVRKRRRNELEKNNKLYLAVERQNPENTKIQTWFCPTQMPKSGRAFYISNKKYRCSCLIHPNELSEIWTSPDFKHSLCVRILKKRLKLTSLISARTPTLKAHLFLYSLKLFIFCLLFTFRAEVLSDEWTCIFFRRLRANRRR